MADALILLVERSGADRLAIFGYSMGAGLAAAVASRRPEIVSHLVLGGVGGRMLRPGGSRLDLAAAMRADDPADIADPLTRGFRIFAEAQGEDRLALAACAERRNAPLALTELARLAMPVLVLAGARDEIAGDPAELAAAIPGARAATIPGCDHFSTIPHALTKAAVFDFLEGWPDDLPAFE